MSSTVVILIVFVFVFAVFFFFNDTATTEIYTVPYTLSLHDALPICIGGVVIGALVVNGAPELLRSSANARFLFYGVLVLALLVAMKPWYKPVIVLLGTIAFGFAVHGIASAVWSRGTAGHIEGGGQFGRGLEHWVLLPRHTQSIAGWAYFALILAALVLTMLHGWQRLLALIPTLYLASFVWENKLVE